jgi:hypothetical protein
VRADADGASWRTRQRRREADIAFLEKLRTATLDEVRELERNHAGKKAPQWKKVAIERAFRRLVAGLEKESEEKDGR